MSTILKSTASVQGYDNTRVSAYNCQQEHPRFKLTSNMKQITVIVVLASLVACSLAVMDLSKAMEAIDSCGKAQELPEETIAKIKSILTKYASAMVPGSDPAASVEIMEAETQDLFKSASFPEKFAPFRDCVKSKMQ